MFAELTIGWDYAWWFPTVYVVITVGIMVIYGNEFTKKFLRLPSGEFKWKVPTIISSTLFSRGIMAYAIVLPVDAGTPWLWIGIVVFSIGTSLTAISMINFANTPLDQPVTKGIYRITRNPIQLTAIIILAGIGIATISWIIIAASVLLAVVSYPTFLIQERSCLEMYGISYQEYMRKTPRWIGIPKP
ncbi:methyltransferase family protein [Chloroflexota bacterium]